MKALLLYPHFPDTFWSLRHALKFVRKRSAIPPLGLLTVAAMLPRDWEIHLVDLNVQWLSEKDLAWADIVFISAMGIQKASAIELIDRCRAAGVKVVAGGPLFTSEPELFPQVNHLVLNEAELTLPPFLEDLKLNCAKHLYQTSEFADLRQSPIPRWDLLKIQWYYTLSIQYSRGCPFNCEFCNITSLYGRYPRTKTQEQILLELDALGRAGWRGGVFFVDDNLIGNKKNAVTELLPTLIQWRADHPRSGTTFNTQASINVADDPQLLRLLSKAGFDTIFIGIETPDNDTLAQCGKIQNRRRDLLQDVRKILRAGIQVQGGFIVGFDADGPSIFQRQIDFIQKSGIVTAMVGLLNALPGTALYDRIRREGRLLGDGTGDNVDGTTNIRPIMNFENLRAGYRQILQSIYSPKSYYQRLRTFLREFKTPDVRAPIDATKLFAFLRSIFSLGIVGRERIQYWRLILWTLFRRPRNFSIAVTLAITGHHFRRICERRLACLG